MKKGQTICGNFNKRNPLSEERLAKIITVTIKRVGVAVTVTNTQTYEIKKFNNQRSRSVYRCN